MNIFKYLKSAIKHISHNPRNSGINIFGLGIGIGVFVLILLYVRFQNSYNTFHEKLDDIYRVEGSLGGITPASFYPYFSERTPQISNGTRIVNVNSLLNYTREGEQMKPGIDAKIFAVDSTFLDIFTYPISKGSKAELFESGKNIALSEEVAHKLFGDENPINKVIRYGTGDITVKAIFKDVPDHSSLSFDALKLLPYDQIDDQNWGRWFMETYYVIDSRFDVEEVESKLDTLNKQRYISNGHEIDKLPYNINLRPYKDIYFSHMASYHHSGEKSHIFIFTLIAIFVLVIAAINYINLSTASASTRLKELALRKVNGARRRDIIYQILSESFLLAFLSVLFATLLIEFSLPYFRNLTGKEIYLEYTPSFIFLLFVFTPLFLGLLAGIYPALYISRFNVLEVLRGKWIYGKSGAAFRKTLTILQFSISIFLIIGTLFVYSQLKYIQKYDPGYEKEQIVSFFTNNELREHWDSFKDRLQGLSSVSGVTRTNTNIHNVSNVMSAYYDKSVSSGEDAPTVGNLLVDEDFLNFFDIQLKKGKAFTESMTRGENKHYLINEKFEKIFPSDTVLGQRINGNEIIGIVEDIKTKSLYQEQQPFVIQLGETNRAYIGYVKIKAGDYASALNQIRGVWQEYVPEHPFRYKFLDESFMQMYEDDMRFGKAFLIFSVFSILIACLGLFALVSFSTERKTKEIGIRKALGATSSKVVLLLIRQFTIWVIVANLIAWPVAHYFLKNWLQNFNEHISIQVTYFLAAAILSFLVALLTILFKATRAANANPVNSLRYE